MGRLAQSSVGLHEHQADSGEFVGHLVDVPAQDRREVGVDDRGVPARDQFDQRTDLVRGADLGEARVARDLGDPGLVGRVAVAVQEDDGGGAEPLAVGGGERLADGGFVQGPDDVAVGVDPFGNLDHARVHRFGEHDVTVEEPGPVLVGDAEGVAEALGDEQDGRFAAALQEGVGGHGGAHPDDGDPVGGDGFVGPEAQEETDSGDGGVLTPGGIVGEHLAGDEVGRRGACPRRR